MLVSGLAESSNLSFPDKGDPVFFYFGRGAAKGDFASSCYAVLALEVPTVSWIMPFYGEARAFVVA